MFGEYEQLLQELHREDRKGYKNYLRIEPGLFGEMVDRVTPVLAKTETKMRFPLPVGLKLAVTLRYLATGNSYSSLMYNFRVSKSAICLFIPKVCQALIDAYGECLKCPKTLDEWNNVAEGFARKWNYFNCVGALDGKHVAIKKPNNTGSLFFNYKKFHSIVLMALADSNYKFLYVDVGAEGGAGDGGTWQKCNLHDAINKNYITFPDDTPLPNATTSIPYHIVGDDAFALKPFLMKPYSHQSQVYEERIFSYRLSRARRVVENSFGLLQMRFRVFGTTMQQRPSVVKLITVCGCVLHNLILDRYSYAFGDVDREDSNYNLVPGMWRDEKNLMVGLMNRRGSNYTNRAKDIRDYLSHYYTSQVGQVSWQDRVVYPRGRPSV